MTLTATRITELESIAREHIESLASKVTFEDRL